MQPSESTRVNSNTLRLSWSRVEKSPVSLKELAYRAPAMSVGETNYFLAASLEGDLDHIRWLRANPNPRLLLCHNRKDCFPRFYLVNIRASWTLFFVYDSLPRTYLSWKTYQGQVSPWKYNSWDHSSTETPPSCYLWTNTLVLVIPEHRSSFFSICTGHFIGLLHLWLFPLRGLWTSVAPILVLGGTILH